MKKASYTLLTLLLCTQVTEAGRVSGYTRKDGTYVAPYYRNSPSKSGTSSSSSAPTYTNPTYTPPRFTTLPTDFKGKPCGNSYISQEKTCLIGTLKQKKLDFRNCTEAWENGVQDIPRSSTAYADKLDRDHDGIACEVSDMYDGTTWMYGREDQAQAVTNVPITIGTAARMVCTGMVNIPSTSEFYNSALDVDKDGFSCEDNGDDNQPMPLTARPVQLPMATVTGQTTGKYIPLTVLSALGAVSNRDVGVQEFMTGGRMITYQEKQRRTPEGFALNEAPYFVGKELVVPIGSVKFVGCSVDVGELNYHIECPNGTALDGVLIRK